MEEYKREDDEEDDTALNGADLMYCGKILSVKMGLVQIFSRAGDGNRDPDGAKYTKQINPPQVSSPMKDTTILL